MKKCPKCRRTYADDGFTFCLEDGALLSAPYDGVKEEPPVSTILGGGPPPTLVLPRTEAGGHKALPTVKTAPSPANAEEAKPQIPFHPESPRRTSPLKYVAIGLAALVIVATGLGFLGLYVAGSNCPRLLINCSPSGATTYCDVAEDKTLTSDNLEAKPISAALCSRSIFLLQEAALPEGVTDVSWSTSLGTPRWIRQRQLIIDTSELAGKTVEVKAKVTTSSWFCSTTVSTSFNVPSAPAK